MDHIPSSGFKRQDREIYHSQSRIKVPVSVTVGLEGDGADIELCDDLEWMNYSEQPKGKVLGMLNTRDEKKYSFVINEANYLLFKDAQIFFKNVAIPAMITKNLEAIRNDSVGYFMKRLP